MPGRTFTYVEGGAAKGLVKNKKICFIMARGGQFSDKPDLDFQGRYLKAIFGFLGITNQIEIIVENTGRTRKAEESLETAIKDAREKAKNF